MKFPFPSIIPHKSGSAACSAKFWLSQVRGRALHEGSQENSTRCVTSYFNPRPSNLNLLLKTVSSIVSNPVLHVHMCPCRQPTPRHRGANSRLTSAITGEETPASCPSPSGVHLVGRKNRRCISTFVDNCVHKYRPQLSFLIWLHDEIINRCQTHGH